MKNLFLTAAFLFLGIHGFAQTVVELTGTPISAGDNTQNPVANVFDGDTATYCRVDGTMPYIGCDFGSRRVITEIVYCPRTDNKPQEYAERLRLGIFEGANNADFGDAVAFAIIADNPNSAYNRLTINNTRAFRYVRFIFPNNNNGLSKYMAELKFFGYQSNGANTTLPHLTNLPTVNIHTIDNQDITSKETYIKGIVSIVYDNGTKIFSDSLEIRGRGNNSWSHPKKPYRMKLKNSTHLMGLPAKARNWTLINAYGDKTLMRNILAFDFSKRIGMPYTSPSEAVDVVLNGDYKGTYLLCDHIDVRENRVDVEEMTDTDVTGGYLIEIDAYASGEINWFTSQNYGIPVSLKYPGDSEITQAQKNYIQNHFNKMTSSVAANNYRDSINGFRKYLDMESFLRYFLVGEYTGNTDTYWSTRMSKKKNEDKFVTGPVWDYDLGFENDWRTYPIMQKTVERGNEFISLWEGGTSAAGNMKGLLRRVLSDPAVMRKMENIYTQYRDAGAISKPVINAVIDSCVTLLYQSQDLNFKRWNIMNTQVHENPVIYGSYEGEVENVRNYIMARMEWLDTKLNFTPQVTAVHITPETVSLRQGESFHFEATVDASAELSNKVSWILLQQHPGTTIDSLGNLSIGLNETSPTLTVRAYSKVNSQKHASAVVTVLPKTSGFDNNVASKVQVFSRDNTLFVSHLPENALVKIADMRGIVVAERNNETDISLSLPSGIYIVVINVEGAIYRYKVGVN